MSPFTRTNRTAFDASEDPKFNARFGIAQDNVKINDLEERQAAQLDVREQIFTAALEIRNLPGESRQKSLALTALEEALMWSGKHIFTVDVPELEQPHIISSGEDYPWAEKNG